ncbi:MAG: hypothetical protein WEF86_14290 [Gemmatimonadota bacterium]
MRLPNVERGHRLPQKLKIALIRVLSGARVHDIVRTLLYRPQFFGTPFRAWVHEILRGASYWSVGERELMAAFTSDLNECRY